MTDEEKREQANAKRSETYRKKREREEARKMERNEQYRDATQGRALCRQIRDSDTATDADRLMAISLLLQLTGGAE